MFLVVFDSHYQYLSVISTPRDIPSAGVPLVYLHLGVTKHVNKCMCNRYHTAVAVVQGTDNALKEPMLFLKINTMSGFLFLRYSAVFCLTVYLVVSAVTVLLFSL